MPKPEKELRIRDEQRDLGEELLEAVRAIKDGQIGRVHMMRLAERGHGIDRVSFTLAGDEFQQFVDHLDAPTACFGKTAAFVAPITVIGRRLATDATKTAGSDAIGALDDITDGASEPSSPAP